MVENKDRLTRFGFGYFETLLPKLGCELVVMNRDAEERDDLMKDMVAILTSFCCRLYVQRRGKSKVAVIKQATLCFAPSALGTEITKGRRPERRPQIVLLEALADQNAIPTEAYSLDFSFIHRTPTSCTNLTTSFTDLGPLFVAHEACAAY